MKFKIPKGTPLFKAVMAAKKRMDACDDAAEALALELGAEDYYHDSYFLAGGIAGLRFRSKPEGWKQVGTNYNVFLPKAAMKELCQRIKDLPKMHVEEMASVLEYTMYCQLTHIGFSRHRLPAMTFLPNHILLSTHDGDPWKGVDGAVEILASEYEALARAGRPCK